MSVHVLRMVGRSWMIENRGGKGGRNMCWCPTWYPKRRILNWCPIGSLAGHNSAAIMTGRIKERLRRIEERLWKVRCLLIWRRRKVRIHTRRRGWVYIVWVRSRVSAWGRIRMISDGSLWARGRGSEDIPERIDNLEDFTFHVGKVL